MAKAMKILKWSMVILMAVVLVAGILGYMLLVRNIVDVAVIEIGSEFSAEDFKQANIDIEARFLTDLSTLDLTVPGDHSVSIAYNGRAYQSTLRLVDTVPPVVTTRELTRFSTQYPKAEEFIDTIEDNTLTTVAYAIAPDPQQSGSQPVSLRITDLGGNVTFADASVELIFDSQAPVIEGVKDLRVYVGVPVDIVDGITVSDDLDPDAILTVDDGTLDQTQEGEYTVTYKAVDTCGNTAVETATVTVINDTAAPEILGVNKLSMYEGSTISYRSGIVLQDDYDEAPVLQIDSSDVDLSRSGTYKVIYKATDAAGNVAEKKTSITIKKRTSAYVEEAEIYAKADALLAQIITEDMTPVEQVYAIYKEVHSYSYISHSDKTDRLQSAYYLMTKQRGDCYNFCALSSLLFERLGLPQICVKRSDNSGRGSKHYWNMVSVDGGESYYHYDATPTTHFSDEVCLATDAQLDQIERNVHGYFAMDKGVYPQTPQKAP